MIPVVKFVAWGDLAWVKSWRARAASRETARAVKAAERAILDKQRRDAAAFGPVASAPACGTCSTPSSAVEDDLKALRIELEAVKLLAAGPVAGPARAAFQAFPAPAPGSVDSALLQDRMATALRSEFTELRIEFGDQLSRAQAAWDRDSSEQARVRQALEDRLFARLKELETLAANAAKRVDAAEQAVAASGAAADAAVSMVENRMAAHVDAQLKTLQGSLLAFGDVLGKLDARFDQATARFMALEGRADAVEQVMRSADASSAGAVAMVKRLDEEMKALVGSNAALAPMWSAMRDSVNGCLESFTKSERDQETMSATVDAILASLAKRNLLDS